jgi:hypothetical protein
MFEKIYKYVIRWGYITGLFLIIISLPNSKWGMSMSQFVLASAFALERVDLRRAGGFFRKSSLVRSILFAVPFLFYMLLESIYKGLKAFGRNRPALIFSSLLLLHVIGLIFTVDFSYAFKDLRTKLPIFLLPLFISTAKPFNRKYFYSFLFIFIAALLVRTVLNAWSFFHENLVDIRNASKAISHIIIALLICFSIFSLGYFIKKKRVFPVILKILFFLVIVWFLGYLILMQSLTGLIITLLTLVIFLFILIFRSRIWALKWTLLILILVCISGGILYFITILRDYQNVNPTDLTKLDQFTRRGNPYVHNIKDLSTENGNYLWIYIQWDELREAWGKRSNMPLDGLDRKHQQLLNTLVRYLTSKGERKDGDAVERLSDKEVIAIENGVANEIFTDHFGIRGRIFEFLHGYEEYRDKGNPSGSTVMQRFEFWKASIGIIRENWLTGVGTGDMNEAFQQQYQKMHSKLAPDQRWRSHNQFLSIIIGFGIFGFLYFLFSILYPPYALGRFSDYFFLIFFIIAILSMIPEDTIESQAGVTFFAFFYSFLLFGRTEEDPYETVTENRSRS